MTLGNSPTGTTTFYIEVTRSLMSESQIMNLSEQMTNNNCLPKSVNVSYCPLDLH